MSMSCVFACLVFLSQSLFVHFLVLGGVGSADGNSSWRIDGFEVEDDPPTTLAHASCLFCFLWHSCSPHSFPHRLVEGIWVFTHARHSPTHHTFL